jgi:phosphatidylglycerophosphatase A
VKAALARFIATGAYSGYAPFAPGTAGTLVAVLVAPAFARLCATSVTLYALALAAAVAVAIWAAGQVVLQEGSSDPQIIVVDEVVGYLLALAFLPVVSAAAYFAAFVAFRVFDVIKPPPGRRLERLPGGLGVVADDLWAGALSNLVVRALVAGGLV